MSSATKSAYGRCEFCAKHGYNRRRLIDTPTGRRCGACMNLADGSPDPLTTFVPAQSHRPEDVATWEPGPLCECDNMQCVTELPLGAWVYVAEGQAVVFPGHEKEGARTVRFEGWVVEEDDY